MSGARLNSGLKFVSPVNSTATSNDTVIIRPNPGVPFTPATRRNTGLEPWTNEHEILLKEWAEVASIYSHMHAACYRKYRRQHIWLTLPVIIMSTITGTANFAQAGMSSGVHAYAPTLIGVLNIMAAVITTIAQFLRVSEISEGHRMASLAYDKISRSVRVELRLPRGSRTLSGRDLVTRSHAELDRLIEQGPIISPEVARGFAGKLRRTPVLTVPEIVQIRPAYIHGSAYNVPDEPLELFSTSSIIGRRLKMERTVSSGGSDVKQSVAPISASQATDVSGGFQDRNLSKSPPNSSYSEAELQAVEALLQFKDE